MAQGWSFSGPLRRRLCCRLRGFEHKCVKSVLGNFIFHVCSCCAVWVAQTFLLRHISLNKPINCFVIAQCRFRHLPQLSAANFDPMHSFHTFDGLQNATLLMHPQQTLLFTTRAEPDRCDVIQHQVD